MNSHRIESWSRALATPKRPAGAVPPCLDALARVLGAPASRRSVLGAMLAALLASRLARVGIAARQEAVCLCPNPPCFLLEWGGQGGDAGQLAVPSDVAVASNGRVYVADGNHRIQYFDPDGTYRGQWGSTREPFSPGLSVAVAPEGTVYVGDKDNARIQAFDATGTFLSTWGSPGGGEGEFSGPTGVAVAPNGTVYVADHNNRRVQYFDAAGSYLGQWGSFGRGPGQFNAPLSLAVAPDGTVYVAEDDNHRIQYFDATGTFLGMWGSFGRGEGQFSFPNGVSVAPDGTVYVTDGRSPRIQAFDATGAFLAAWGSFGRGEGEFNGPTGVAVAPDGRTVYVSDYRNARIQAFCVAPAITGERQHATPEAGTPSAPDEPDRQIAPENQSRLGLLPKQSQVLSE